MNIFLRIITMVSLLFCTDHSLFSKNLKSITQQFVEAVNPKKHKDLRTIRYAFAKLHYLEENKSPFLQQVQSQEIQDLFLDTKKQAVNEYKQQAQWLIQAHLYLSLYKIIITRSEKELISLQKAIHYWKKELFYESLPFYKKSVFYWLHRSSYKVAAQKHVKNLEKIEKTISTLLGIAYHGYRNLYTISSIEDVKHVILQQAKPLYDILKKEQHNDVMISFNDISKLYQTLIILQKKTETSINKHDVPSHLSRHWFGYSTATLSILGGYLLYKKYEQEVPSKKEIQENSQAWWEYYVAEPTKNLYNEIWNSTYQEIPFTPFDIEADKIKESLKTISENVSSGLEKNKVDLQQLQNSLIDHSFSIIQNKDTQWKHYSIETVKNNSELRSNAILAIKKESHDKVIGGLLDTFSILNNLERRRIVHEMTLYDEVINAKSLYLSKINTANPTLDNLHENINNLNVTIKMAIVNINEAMESLRLTVRIVALIPATIAAAASYQGTTSFYHKYISNEWCYKPIRLIVREIDLLLNTVSEFKEPSFSHDGKLYFLTEQLQKMFIYLSNEDVLLLHDDIKELRNIQTSYMQKRYTLQRMYRTYEFLQTNY